MAKSVTLPKLLEKAQKAFNTFIRNRDKEHGCISCETGQVENAGHYLSQGNHSKVRFDENNVHGQCIRCNKYLHGNLINYRINLVKKIGASAVEYLENNGKGVKKWTREELNDIIKKYTL